MRSRRTDLKIIILIPLLLYIIEQDLSENKCNTANILNRRYRTEPPATFPDLPNRVRGSHLLCEIIAISPCDGLHLP